MSPRGSRSFANVTSMLALITALGGSAYAAVTVTGADIQNGSLTGADIRGGSVGSGDLRNNSVRGSDIREGAVNSDDIENGSVEAEDLHSSLAGGATGPAGPQGERGPAGPAGAGGAGGSGGGSSIVNRTRFSGALTATAQYTQVAVPLTGNTWTQGASQVDQLVGTATATIAGPCVSNTTGQSWTLEVLQRVSGQVVGSGYVSQGGPGTSTIVFPISAANIEPGTATGNELTAQFSDNCTANHYTLRDITIDVIGTT